MSFCNIILKRSISTSSIKYGKRNFKKFMFINKRGTRIFKEQQKISPDPEIPIDKRGVRDIGYKVNDKFVIVPEMIPELIVPDLTDCKLKPYVSYKVQDVVQSEFTTEDLFNSIYGKKILEDFKNKKLNEDGSPMEPSPEEKLTAEEAKLLARKTVTDMF